MSTEAFIMECKEKGISLFLENGDLRIGGKRNVVSAALPIIRENKAAIIRYMQYEAFRQQLEPFRLDDTPDTPETERINNMAWEFMQEDGMPYAEAIRQAAEIAAKCYAAPCEAAYESVMELWKRITGAITNNAHVSAITSQLNKPVYPKLPTNPPGERDRPKA